ncbi:hypothetical protein DY000_02018950 [Brassica cretica]|uniref:Uncharacterized protein n=1 Tax=Brassica cretica TaxID=69181 RepID=A0ABQ7CRC4_BRACR|nr:hypothetical protein DY000_02018950 [Brassica cretica]
MNHQTLEDKHYTVHTIYIGEEEEGSRLHKKELLPDSILFLPLIPSVITQKNDLSVYLEPGRGDRLSSFLKQYIRKLLKVPILDSSSIKWVPNTLVRFRGMIQDMLGNEFYAGAYKVCVLYVMVSSTKDVLNFGSRKKTNGLNVLCGALEPFSGSHWPKTGRNVQGE